MQGNENSAGKHKGTEAVYSTIELVDNDTGAVTKTIKEMRFKREPKFVKFYVSSKDMVKLFDLNNISSIKVFFLCLMAMETDNTVHLSKLYLIGDKQGYSNSYVKKGLSLLVKADLLERLGRGIYLLDYDTVSRVNRKLNRELWAKKGK